MKSLSARVQGNGYELTKERTSNSWGEKLARSINLSYIQGLGSVNWKVCVPWVWPPWVCPPGFALCFAGQGDLAGRLDRIQIASRSLEPGCAGSVKLE